MLFRSVATCLIEWGNLEHLKIHGTITPIGREALLKKEKNLILMAKEINNALPVFKDELWHNVEQTVIALLSLDNSSASGIGPGGGPETFRYEGPLSTRVEVSKIASKKIKHLRLIH